MPGGGGTIGSWTGYTKYTIGSPDPAIVAGWQATYGNQIIMTPDQAAVNFCGSTNRIFAWNQTVVVPAIGNRNAIILTATHGFFNGSAITYNQYCNPFQSAGTFCSTFSSSQDLVINAVTPTVTLKWVGVFQLIQVEDTVTVQPTRRWIDGFELFGSAGAGSSGQSLIFSRDASRTVDGFGYAQRSVANTTRVHSVTTLGGTAGRTSWERLYVRLRRLPTANEAFWATASSSEGSLGAYLYITPTGQIACYNQGNAAAPGELLFTYGPLTLNTWYRLDLLIKYRTAAFPAANDGSIQLYVGGTSVASGTSATNFGLGVAQNHTGSRVGNPNASTSGLELDMDDWMNTSWTGIGVPSDIAAGSHMRLSVISGFGSGHGAWSGNFRELNPIPTWGSASSLLTSSTANDLLDASATVFGGNTQGGAFGMTISVWGDAMGGTSQLGYALNGSTTPILTSLTPSAGTWNTILINFNPAQIISSLDLYFKKDNSATARSVRCIVAEIELRGQWGEGDTGVLSSLLYRGHHNAPYPESDYARGGAPPAAPYVTVGGIYTGNNIGQDVLLNFPAHFWWVRPLAANRAGVRWCSASVAAHQGTNFVPTSDLVHGQFANGTVNMQIAGPNNQANANAESYQYIAICDPAARYISNGAFVHNSSIASIDNFLADPSFTPDGAFFTIEDGGTTSTGMYYKGPGHATNAASLLDSAQSTTIAAMTQGTITSKATLHTGGGSTLIQTSYSVLRNFDTSICAVGQHGLYIGNYTGDGTASRTLSLDFNNRYPLFAMVVPHNAQSWVRDPSHTGTNSSNANQTTQSATAIMGGGLNTLTVGITCNANAIVYDVFVIPGSASGWVNGEFTPVDACTVGCGPTTPWECAYGLGCVDAFNVKTSSNWDGCASSMPVPSSSGGNGCAL